MAGAFSFRIAEIGNEFAGAVGHIRHAFRIIMDKDSMVGINRAMLGKDPAVRAVAGCHVGEHSLIEEMLPVIISAVILMRLFAAEHRRGEGFQRRVDPAACECTTFHLPGIWYFQLIQQLGIMSDHNRVRNPEAAPLVGRAELIPVADPVGDIPFKEIIVRRILLVDIDFIAGREINLLRLLIDHLAHFRLLRPATVVKH